MKLLLQKANNLKFFIVQQFFNWKSKDIERKIRFRSLFVKNAGNAMNIIFHFNYIKAYYRTQHNQNEISGKNHFKVVFETIDRKQKTKRIHGKLAKILVLQFIPKRQKLQQ